MGPKKMAPTGSKKEGNTNPPSSPSKRGNSAKNWFFTWNNYPSDWKVKMAPIFDRCDIGAVQEETGENGTKHLQGVISLVKKDRWSSFGIPTAHWETCKDLDAALLYCTKEETRSGEQLIKGYKKKRPLKLLKEEQFYPWQKSVVDMLRSDTDPGSKIYWFWEPTGQVGKTSIAKWLCYHMDAVPLDGAKGDILYCAAEFESDIYIYIPSREVEHFSYDSLEKVNDGLYMCAKYESKPVIRNNPWVLVFANRAPDYSRMSIDRWVVTEISKN